MKDTPDYLIITLADRPECFLAELAWMDSHGKEILEPED